MMRLILFPLILFVLSLYCNNPTFNYKLPQQDLAFSIVEKNFKEIFPMQVLEPPPVSWSTVYCPGTLKTAVVIDNECYAGIYRTPGEPQVAWRGSFGESAFSHELMHYYLKKFDGDEDANHQNQSAWQVVQKADGELQSMQL